MELHATDDQERILCLGHLRASLTQLLPWPAFQAHLMPSMSVTVEHQGSVAGGGAIEAGRP